MSFDLASTATAEFRRADLVNLRSCIAYAWATLHRPDVVPDSARRAIRRKEAIRQQLVSLLLTRFPDTRIIDATDGAVACAETRVALESGIDAIAGATVRDERGFVAVADLLTRDGNGWRLHDVRATTNPRRDHLEETAWIVAGFCACGVEITAVTFWSLRKDFVRHGDASLPDVLIGEDVTQRVGAFFKRAGIALDTAAEVASTPESIFTCLCDMGTRVQRCPTFEHFHPVMPSGDTIYDLNGITAGTIETLLERGISQLTDWPDDVRATPRQHQQIAMVRTGQAQVDIPRLAQFLRRLTYPLHFLDYETFQHAIPIYDGTSPWAHLPFQYSLHVLHADGRLDHHGLLWRSREHPASGIVADLRSRIGPIGSVVVWNKGFEQIRNQELARLLPGHANFLLDLNARMIDLMDVVRLGLWLDPRFNGSSSIKKVLPVAAPDLSYDDLPIGDGALASECWLDAVFGTHDQAEAVDREAVFTALELYCHLDTLALVRVFERVQSLVRVETPGP